MKNSIGKFSYFIYLRPFFTIRYQAAYLNHLAEDGEGDLVLESLQDGVFGRGQEGVDHVNVGPAGLGGVPHGDHAAAGRHLDTRPGAQDAAQPEDLWLQGGFLI